MCKKQDQYDVFFSVSGELCRDVDGTYLNDVDSVIDFVNYCRSSLTSIE